MKAAGLACLLGAQGGLGMFWFLEGAQYRPVGPTPSQALPWPLGLLGGGGAGLCPGGNGLGSGWSPGAIHHGVTTLPPEKSVPFQGGK